MIRIDASELDELVLHVPAKRVYKVLLSPTLQPELRGLSMGMTIYPPGSSNALHNHSESQEVWYVVHGEGEMRVGDERFALKPDTVVVVPPGPYHQITNTGERELKVLWMFTPPGPEQDFIPHKESG